jgi:phosphatidylserine/phosphatidylglycerophosphate/cardiolipin synthase-like enzyme
LLGGVNVSKLYNGNTSQNMSGYNFTWYDSGILLKDEDKRIYKFIHNLFHTIKYDAIRENIIISKQIQLISNNYDAYTELVNAIRQSKQNIYIENQYLASHKKHTTNKIAYEIAMRINRAINENKQFSVVLVINYRNYDETNVVQFCMTNTWLGTLYYIRSLVNCDDNMFSKYITPTKEKNETSFLMVM